MVALWIKQSTNNDFTSRSCSNKYWYSISHIQCHYFAKIFVSASFEWWRVAVRELFVRGVDQLVRLK